MAARESPVILQPSTGTKQAGALIFLHGLDDEAAGVSNIGEQLQSAGRLPHFKYVFPNATDNRDMMARAWYLQTGLSARPAPRPELEEDEDEDGLLRSINYVESLIADLVKRDTIPLERIVVGGFSQGQAVTLLLSLISEKFAGRLGGVLAVCGYLPLDKRISGLQEEHEIDKGRLPGRTRIFIMRGGADPLVPKRYLAMACETIGQNGYLETQNDGQKANLIIKEYEGVPHTITGTMIKDMSEWLQDVVPEV